MNHLDLFSGIGGFAIAAREVWKDDYRCVGFCDNDWFCQQVLKKNFPGVPIWNDIWALADTPSKGLPEEDRQIRPKDGKMLSKNRKRFWDVSDTENSHVDLITGGFPCQPFSAAGKRRGTDDERHLWPAMLKVIQRFSPTWVLAENVRGILSIQDGLVFETVCSDLEASGYEVWPFVIPACALNAPHRRDRVWIVGYLGNPRGKGELPKESGLPKVAQPRGGDTAVGADAPDTDTGKRQEHEPQAGGQSSWGDNWPEAAARLCRVDDGLPKRMVRLPNGSQISQAKWRKEALKAYGNAIVPQVAEQIFRAMREFDMRPTEILRKVEE